MIASSRKMKDRKTLPARILLFAVALFPASVYSHEKAWQVDWGRLSPIRLDIRKGWANQRAPDGPLRKWVVQGQPFLADGRSLGPVNAITPLRGLPVGLAGVNRLHFLHWGQPGKQKPEYRVYYRDGTRVRIPITPGKRFGYAKWYFDKKYKPGQPNACQVWTWENPHPGKMIHWIDMHTRRSVGIYLLAMTAETKGVFTTANPADVRRAAARHVKRASSASGKGRILQWESLPDQQRPRLLFARTELRKLKARLRRGVPAYLFGRYKPQADGGDISGYVNFVAWLGNREGKYLRQSRRHLFELTKELLLGLKSGDSPQMPGRRMASACFEYDFLSSQGSLSRTERQLVRQQLATAMYMMVDGNYWQPLKPTADFRPDNMSSFLLNGIASFGLTFPRHPRSSQLVRYVQAWYDHMLNASFGRDGGYMESMGYAYAAYWPMLNVAYMFRQNKIVDLFADKRFQKATHAIATLMVYPDHETAKIKDPNCSIFLTRPKRRMFSVGFGNANFGGAGAYWLYLAAAGFRAHDSRLAGELMWIWDRCGQPLTPGHAFGLEFVADSSIQRVKPALKSAAFRDVGRVLLRDPGAEVYCLFLGGPKGPHHHLDKGSFSLQAYGHMLSVDPGVATWTNTTSYNRSLRQWFSHPRSHNTLTFSGADPGPAAHGRLVDFRTDKLIDYACVELRASQSVRLWRRHIIYVRPDLYIIWDQLISHLAAQFNYHPIAKRVTRQRDGINIVGRHGVDTKFVVLLPQQQNERIVLSEDQKQWRSQEGDAWGVPKRVQVKAKPGESFLVLIHPFRKSNRLTTKRVASDVWKFTVGQLSGTIQRRGTGSKSMLTVTCGISKLRTKSTAK